MARHKRQQLEPDEEPALDISSLIDVCFLLLIYFLVTSTIKPRESDLGLQLPGPASETSEPPDIGPMLIHIEGQGAIYTGADKTPMDMDESSRDLPLLDEALKFYKDGVDAAGEKPLVQDLVVAVPRFQVGDLVLQTRRVSRHRREAVLRPGFRIALGRHHHHDWRRVLVNMVSHGTQL